MKKILYKVRHGLHPSQCEWAHKEFMEIGNLHDFLNKHLNEENAETELRFLIQGIREGKVPQIWHITPDATPDNIIDIMKKNGFKDLSEGAPEPEPTMSLHKKDFVPYEEDSSVICRKISAKKDYKLWIDVVNTALHGWDMIDADHYFIWVESNNIKIYLAEINGIIVSTCATIQNNNTVMKFDF